MKKKIIAFFTSFLLLIPVFTIPVKAEDEVYYWDGFYYAISTGTVSENLVNAYNSCSRFKFNYLPSGHALVSNGTKLYYDAFWLVNSQSEGNTLLSELTVIIEFCLDGSNVLSSNEVHDFYFYNLDINGTTYYYILFERQINNQFPVRNSHIPFIKSSSAISDTGFEYCHGLPYTADLVVDDIYSNNIGYGMTLSQLLQFNNAFHSHEYFSQKVINLMTGNYYLPNGEAVDPNNPSVVEPTSEPTSEPTEEPTVEPSAPSSSSSSSQQQQQYQTISENAVNVTVTENDVISEETIQRLDQTLQNNNPYQTTFSTAVQTIDGFRQIGVKFAQTSEAFLDFLPSWVTDLLSLMFVLLFFFIVLRLLKVFHG